MRIAIDCRMWEESGNGRYLRGLVRALERLDIKNEYFLLLLAGEYKTLSFSDNFTKVKADFKWYGLKEQVELPRILKSLKVDLAHFPHFNVPVFYSGDYVVTIHDLIHQKFSMQRASTRGALMHKLKQLGYKQGFRAAVFKSRRIITPSEYVKNELVLLWGVDPEKITVTHEAVDESWQKLCGQVSNGSSGELNKRLGIGDEYLFYVGNVHPHKNVEKLIEAFKALKEKHPKLQLVIAGSENYFQKRLVAENMGVDGLKIVGKVSDGDLATLYSGARAFVTASLEEGFGLPLIEAFAAGCPVVCSDRASLPEVGGEACLYFDPNDIGDMVEKIAQVLDNGKLREDLIRSGRKRVEKFSWEKLAKKTLGVYMDALN